MTHTVVFTTVHSIGVYTHLLVVAPEDSADFSAKGRVHVQLSIYDGGEFGRRRKFMQFLAELLKRLC